MISGPLAYCVASPVGVIKTSLGADRDADVSTVTGGGAVGAAAATEAPTSADRAPTRMAPTRAVRRHRGARRFATCELDIAVPFMSRSQGVPTRTGRGNPAGKNRGRAPVLSGNAMRCVAGYSAATTPPR